MGQRQKIYSLSFEMILWILLLVVLPLVLLTIYSYSSTIAGLKDMEREQIVVKSQVAEKLIANLGDSIIGVTISNGLWSDNRDALQAKDREWLQQNILTIPDLVPNIDFVSEADLQGNVLVQNGDIAELTGTVKLPVIMDKFKDTKGFTGLTDTSKGLAIIAVSPVTDDTGLETPIGMIITGRLIDAAVLESIDSTLQSHLAVLMQSGQFLSSNETIMEAKVQGFLNNLLTTGNEMNVFTAGQINGASMAKVAVSFRDMTGQAVGVLYLESPSKASGEVAMGLGKLGIFTGIIRVLLIILVLYLLRKRIILPLRQFALTMEQIAAGESIKAIPKSMLKADAKIVGAFQQIIEWNHSLERTVGQRTQAVRNLLDAAGQGFMSFSDELVISEEHSAECNRIFNQEVVGKSLPELMYPENGEEQKLLRSILVEYFHEQDENAKELIFSLLPSEIYIRQIPIQLDYRIITDNDGRNTESIMVILTDISEKRQLETKMDTERQMLKMVIRVMTNYDDFVELVREYEYFYQAELYEFLHSGGTLEQHIMTIFKRLHTLKGNCGLMYLINIVPHLHYMEGQLANYLKRQEPIIAEEFIKFIGSFDMKQWLNEDIALLRNILGDEFLHDEQTHLITIDIDRFLEFEYKIGKVLTSEKDRVLLLELKKWRYKPIRSFFKSYPEFIQRLADREGISIHPMIIEGGDSLVDPDWFQSFAKTLIHVVRNIVVHGIEDSEERIEAGKEQQGSIKFIIRTEANQLLLTIADDGRGIDPEAIRNIVVEKGLSDLDHSRQLSDTEVIEYIFNEEFSSKEEVTELAGRGMGLSSVKAAVESLGGYVQVKTVKGSGTSFEFSVPLPKSDQESQGAIVWE